MNDAPDSAPTHGRTAAAAFAGELNGRQLEAVNTLGGPLLILAGAGSGKTRVIIYRIARLIEAGVPPGGIMALTFTNKAAAEMKTRALALLGSRTGDPWISTFHSACLRILRTNAERIGYPKDFAVYDAKDQTRLIKACLNELGAPEKAYPARQMGALISRFKNRLQGPQRAQEELNATRHRTFLECFSLYEAKLREAGVMDFDDLLGRTVELFRRDGGVRERFQERFAHILVDEFQDTNVAQYELVRLLVGPGRNICVVGDDDQSIYQWRGANVENILHFERDFPDAKVILLEQNYRSTGAILSAASDVVARNPGRKKKRLWTKNAAGERIVIYTASDEMDEAAFTAAAIRRLVKNGAFGLNDIAVFYRTNSQSRALEETLRREGFPYLVYGGLKFYDRKEVKDLLAYFKVALNPMDTLGLKRIINTPPRGIGATTLEKMEAAAHAEGAPLAAMLDDIGAIEGLRANTITNIERFREILARIKTFITTLSPPDALKQALEVTGYRDWLMEDKHSESLTRMDNLDELINAAAEFVERTGDRSMLSFLDQAALVSDADMVEDGAGGGAVKLMTVHVSKGLEFPAVFVTGLEENLFPHARSKDDPGQMQEERRLLYVAMTRAKQKLYLSHAQSRRIMGVAQRNMPSSFLDDLPEETLVRERGSGLAAYSAAHRGERARAVPRRARAVSVSKRSRPGEEVSIGGLGVGVTVTHPDFQTGVIRKIEGRGERSKVTVYFPRYGEKKLVMKFAKLEIVS